MKSTVSTWVKEKIREAILSGEFTPKQRLLQDEIASWLEVSRMPVREALNELKSEGLVISIPYKGFTVAKFGGEDVREIFNIRSALETLALKLAIENFNKKDEDELYGYISKMEGALKDNNYSEYSGLNYQFHMYIYKKSKSERLISLIEDYWCYFPHGLHEYLKTSQIEISFNEHKSIVDFIHLKKIPDAVDLLECHIINGGKALTLKMNPSFNW